MVARLPCLGLLRVLTHDHQRYQFIMVESRIFHGTRTVIDTSIRERIRLLIRARIRLLARLWKVWLYVNYNKTYGDCQSPGAARSAGATKRKARIFDCRTNRNSHNLLK